MWAPNGLVRALSHVLMADQDGLILPLFYPFTALVEGRATGEVTLTIKTTYPESGQVRVIIDRCQHNNPWRLKLRLPSWSRLASAKVNGAGLTIDPKQSWLEITRVWRPGDELALDLPLDLWLARTSSDEELPIPETEGRAGFEEVRVFRGPMLLGVDQPRDQEKKWIPGEKLVLFLTASGRKLDSLPAPGPVPNVDEKLSYSKARGTVPATLKTMIAKSEQPPKSSQNVVLTPIAEFPGKVGEVDIKEAVLFDVVVERSSNA